MKRWSIFPRSLRQLVMMAFLLILLPLLVLAWQAWQSLNALSAQAAQTNRTTLVDARRSEAMTNAALEMERSYRQYCVLDDRTLAKVYQNQRKRYSEMLDAHAGVLPDDKLYQALRQDLNDLGQLQCKNSGPDEVATAKLEAFASANTEMVQSTRAVISSRGLQLQQEIAERGQFFGWQALVLFLVSLGLVLLFTRMIIGPVKGIERMINRLGEGKSLGNTVVFKGPRELRSVGQRIIWLSERLQWLESQRHQFLRHISHELKTPLASMREGTELLADEVAGPLTTEQKEIVEILDDSSRNLQKLIEQLLDYNRKLADGAVELEKVEIEPLVDMVLSAHSLPARAKMMHTELDLQEPVCFAEPMLLMSVLDNLYSNAVHYGTESGNIYIRSFTHNSRVCIDVANTGSPIPDDEQKMIFEPFFQGSHQRKGAVKGSGLGLSIARDCIRRMHGELYISHDDRADVCFRIELPLEPEKSMK
ncbi:two component system sensor histidine kinase QseE/GlrK [Lelliottia sp. V106_10]|uniref:histidine kinase n=1 Tax=Lelliottia wanjuensis TaxID=3050585 RepID=A0AAP4D4H3_9ENTR|nr:MULTISPECIES: two component system sensor histidine kinase QseE/GlrK [unclassified Lelliottia]MDI3361669.1 two component system sensor histidine kinase QseE/GlrK [Lelliottia sp. V89_13]MDK9358505.1 two component system sensor histidine kinase QseE/GlrK [Lelliottia sp. V106_16]MDK9365116.1 two component system sensor histidine kinase QseE/GlrK [Lelliottia sp. V106_12]MDK9376410.1 two component system sensor histidine kinase QseE/GlrK [Lelliottia sp. V106_10]MDK9551604.1 two component system 